MQTFAESLIADVQGMSIMEPPATYHFQEYCGYAEAVIDHRIVDALDLSTYLQEHRGMIDWYESTEEAGLNCGWVRISDTEFENRSECEIETYTFTRLNRVEDELILMLKIEGIADDRYPTIN